MANHIAQSFVSNPMDYNRAQIQGLCKLIDDMKEAINVAPENFAAIDLNTLTTHVNSLRAIISAVFVNDWTLVKS